jgi:thiosulfate/3-mercaptopyruvate sulfurtransferase
MSSFLAPDVLVDTTWVTQHMNDNKVRIVECDSDPNLYSMGHIAGAVRLDCQGELVDKNTRDLIGVDQFQKLAQRLGISNTSEVVFYGDQHNIQACFAYWVFRSLGHEKLKILDGGRTRWVANGLKLSRETTLVTPGHFEARPMLKQFRALREDVLKHIGPTGTATRKAKSEGRTLVDDRTEPEYRGVFAADSGYPPRFLRAGHIPGATNVPWNELLSADGTFKTSDEIRKIFSTKGITPDQDIVVYTRIGERASVTWFVLHELLGFPRVRTYDGSWTEWGNTVGMPIENGAVVPIPTGPMRSTVGRQGAMPTA